MASKPELNLDSPRQGGRSSRAGEPYAFETLLLHAHLRTPAPADTDALHALVLQGTDNGSRPSKPGGEMSPQAFYATRAELRQLAKYLLANL